MGVIGMIEKNATIVVSGIRQVHHMFARHQTASSEKKSIGMQASGMVNVYQTCSGGIYQHRNGIIVAWHVSMRINMSGVWHHRVALCRVVALNVV